MLIETILLTSTPKKNTKAFFCQLGPACSLARVVSSESNRAHASALDILSSTQSSTSICSRHSQNETSFFFFQSEERFVYLS